MSIQKPINFIFKKNVKQEEIIKNLKLNDKQIIFDNHWRNRNKTTKFITYGGAAGGGKSFILSYSAIKDCILYKGVRILVGRKRLKTLKETTLLTIFNIFDMLGMKEDFSYKYNQIEGTITLSNGSVLLLKDLFFKPSDPTCSAFGGLELTKAIIDEGNEVDIRVINTLKTRVGRWKNLEYGIAPKTAYSCNPDIDSWIYTEVYDKYTKNELRKEEVFIPALITDNKENLSEHYIRQFDFVDDKTRQRMFDGNWLYMKDPSKLCDYDSIMNVFHNEDYVNDKLKQRFITADIAFQGNDLFVCLVWEGFIVIDSVIMQVSDGADIVNTISGLRSRYIVSNSNIIYDGQGVGQALQGFLNRCTSFPPKIANSRLDKQKYRDLRSYYCHLLADYINAGQIHLEAKALIPYKDRIIKELNTLKNHNYHNLNTTQFWVNKDEQKKSLAGLSPDFVDALMQRMYFLTSIVIS